MLTQLRLPILSLAALATLCLSSPVFADYACSFVTRSTANGIDKLGGHVFRVVSLERGGELIEQRTADGGWLLIASVAQVRSGAVVVFVDVPSADSSENHSAVLTIQDGGTALLLVQSVHYGSITQMQGWLYRGSCEVAVGVL